MDWKEIYKKVLGICEEDSKNFDIIEQGEPEFNDILVENKDANENSLFKLKLNEELAKEKDYKDFCKYIYAYIGLNIDDFISNNFDKTEEEDFNLGE